jgi:hypothetical protein
MLSADFEISSGYWQRRYECRADVILDFADESLLNSQLVTNVLICGIADCIIRSVALGVESGRCGDGPSNRDLCRIQNGRRTKESGRR